MAAELARYRQDIVGSVQTYARAFAAYPELLEERGYDAAAAAALAGCGFANSTDLDDSDRARLRQQALEWLSTVLNQRKSEINAGGKGALDTLKKLRDWLIQRDLSGVRDPDAFEQLPDSEAEQWRVLWSDLANVLREAERKKE